MEGDRRTKSTVGGGGQENKEYGGWRGTGEQRVQWVEGDRRTKSTVGGGGQDTMSMVVEEDRRIELGGITVIQ